jgi:hypothetical protein
MEHRQPEPCAEDSDRRRSEEAGETGRSSPRRRAPSQAPSAGLHRADAEIKLQQPMNQESVQSNFLLSGWMDL